MSASEVSSVAISESSYLARSGGLFAEGLLQPHAKPPHRKIKKRVNPPKNKLEKEVTWGEISEQSDVHTRERDEGKGGGGKFAMDI